MNKGLTRTVKLGDTLESVLSVAAFARKLNRGTRTIRRYISDGVFHPPIILVKDVGYYTENIVLPVKNVLANKKGNRPLSAEDRTKLNVIFNQEKIRICQLEDQSQKPRT